ncbi:MAG TPA: hypothetical protein VKH44_06275, partial [Pirellulaceae bacterium]|nr:hypothetical protein [Pirellulaceae bacterium]
MRREGYRRKVRRPLAHSARQLRVEPLEARALLSADGISASLASYGTSGGEGETTPVVRYSVRALVPGTDTPLTEILPGREFDMQVLVQDLRGTGSPNRGVFAAYTDLLYDKSLAKFRVAEIQALTIDGSPTGSFTLTLNPGQTTPPIIYDLSTIEGSAALPGDIQAALNGLLGAGTVLVTPDFQIRFIGQYDVDEPTLQSSNPDVTVQEIVKGDPTLVASFTEAFRSLGLPNGKLPSAYQNGLSAIDGSDRVDELGATAGFGLTGRRVVELVRARVKATLPANQISGNLVFTPDFADIITPAHATLVFADLSKVPPETSRVPPEEIAIAPTTLTIKSALVGIAGLAAIDEDNTAGVTIPILPLVSKSTRAPAGP